MHKLKPVEYERKAELGKMEIGFVAQELHEVFPQAVSKGGEDPNKQPWLIDYAKLTPVLAKAIQEQQLQIEELKKEINVLKGK